MDWYAKSLAIAFILGAMFATRAIAGDASRSSSTDVRKILAAQIADRVAALLPAGDRLDSVSLECDPPADATLREVAPGVARLQTSQLLVMLEHDRATQSCGVSVRVERQVLAAVRDIGPNEAVSEADFRPQWLDAFAGSTGYLSAFPATGGMVAAVPIRAGQALSASQLTRPAMVHPGELVTVTVTDGPVNLRAQLRSNNNAALGDTATLINPESGQPVTVTITGPKTASLDLQ